MSDPPHGALPPIQNGEVPNLDSLTRKRIGQELRARYALPTDDASNERMSELLMLLERDERGGLTVRDIGSDTA